MNRTFKISALVASIVVLVSSCGVSSFRITSTELEKYATTNSGVFTDLTTNYVDNTAIEGVYVMEANNVHIELWDLDTSTDANKWFSSNVDDLKDRSNLYSGSTATTKGDYTLTVDDMVYHLIFCDDLGIWAEGASTDSVDTILKDIGVLK